MNDQAQGLRELANHQSVTEVRGARVIAVTSGKGGVGKTNLAVNLGIALAGKGLRVGILDADLGLANVDLVLGVVPEFNLGHVLYGERRLAEVLTQGPAGLRVLAGGSGVYELANLSQWRLDRFLRGLKELDEALDILLIDTGAGVGRNVLSFVLAVEEVVIVTTPEPTAIADAYGLVKIVAAKNPNALLRLVVNLAKTSRDGEGVFRRLNLVTDRFLQVQLEYLGHVPPDAAVVRAVQEQEPFMISQPNSAAARAISQLAESLVGSDQAGHARGVGAFFHRMTRFFR